MDFESLMKNAWQKDPKSSVEDLLRAKLLEAETRILKLEREVKMLRGAFPKSGPNPEVISSKVKKKIVAKNQSSEMKFLRMWYPEGFGGNAAAAPQVSVPPPHIQKLTSRQYVYRAFGARCFYCCCQLCEHTTTVDHQIPKSKGGTRAKNNIVASCQNCNNIKGDRMPTPVELERAHTIRAAFDAMPEGVTPIMRDTWKEDREKEIEEAMKPKWPSVKRS